MSPDRSLAGARRANRRPQGSNTRRCRCVPRSVTYGFDFRHRPRQFEGPRDRLGRSHRRPSIRPLTPHRESDPHRFDPRSPDGPSRPDRSAEPLAAGHCSEADESSKADRRGASNAVFLRGFSRDAGGERSARCGERSAESKEQRAKSGIREEAKSEVQSAESKGRNPGRRMTAVDGDRRTSRPSLFDLLLSALRSLLSALCSPAPR